MCDVCFFESQSHWSYESLVFWWFTSEILSYKTYFVYSALPTFALSFAWSNDFEHFCFSHWFYFFNWDVPLACFFFSLLFYHISQHFWVLLLLSVHQICRDRTILYWLGFSLRIFFFVLFNGFLHLNFLLESFFVKYFSLDASKCLCLLRYDFSLPCLFFPSFLFCV